MVTTETSVGTAKNGTLGKGKWVQVLGNITQKGRQEPCVGFCICASKFKLNTDNLNVTNLGSVEAIYYLNCKR